MDNGRTMFERGKLQSRYSDMCELPLLNESFTSTPWLRSCRPSPDYLTVWRFQPHSACMRAAAVMCILDDGAAAQPAWRSVEPQTTAQHSLCASACTVCC